jgi:hypothetical protein
MADPSLRPVRRLVRAIALGSVVALVAAGCGSGSGDDASEESLASFMGWDDREDEDPEAAEARWRDQEAQVQEAIRACMAEEGFEYIPVDHSGGSVMAFDEGGQEEHLRKYGFGITTWVLNDDVEEEVFDEAFDDPNHEIVEAMSDSERDAYYEALYGSDEEMREIAEIEYDEETGEELGYSFSGPGPGCEGAAHAEVYGEGSDTSELWEELQPAFDEMYERVRSDPRIVEAEQDWSRCMAEAGYEYTSQEEMHDSVWEEFDAQLQELMGDSMWADPFEGWTEAEIEAFFEESTDDEIDALFAQAEAEHASSVDEEAVRALQQEEIDLALADHECSGGEERWELWEEVSREYEADLIAENRETLERLRDAESS